MRDLREIAHASLADVILDTAQNSIEAGATRITVDLVEDGVTVSVVITDDGKGMDAATCARAFDPDFTDPSKHPARKVGLGLPILKRLCEACDGACSLESTPGVGTTLKYHFAAKSPLLPPLGNLADALLVLFAHAGDFELVFTHHRGDDFYSISRRELLATLGDLESAANLSLARQFLLRTAYAADLREPPPCGRGSGYAIIRPDLIGSESETTR